MTRKEFISAWLSKITNDGIQQFSSAFIPANNTEVLNLPAKTLIIGEEFFGTFEIIATDGTPVLNADSYAKAKYIIYANRTKPGKILIPKDNLQLKAAISKYENYLDEIIKKIVEGYKKDFPGDKNAGAAVNEIFKLLNLVRC